MERQRNKLVLATLKSVQTVSLHKSASDTGIVSLMVFCLWKKVDLPQLCLLRLVSLLAS